MVKLEISTRKKGAKQNKTEKLLIPNNIDEFRDICKAYRKKNKITIDQVAKYSEISRQGISKFENGKTDIKLSNFLKYAEICGIKILIKVIGDE